MGADGVSLARPAASGGLDAKEVEAFYAAQAEYGGDSGGPAPADRESWSVFVCEEVLLWLAFCGWLLKHLAAEVVAAPVFLALYYDV